MTIYQIWNEVKNILRSRKSIDESDIVHSYRTVFKLCPNPESKQEIFKKVDNVYELIDLLQKNCNTGASSLEGLHELLGGHFPHLREEHFFEKVLPFIQSVVKKTKLILPNEIPILEMSKDALVSLNQNQCLAVLANSFLCTSAVGKI